MYINYYISFLKNKFLGFLLLYFLLSFSLLCSYSIKDKRQDLKGKGAFSSSVERQLYELNQDKIEQEREFKELSAKLWGRYLKGETLEELQPLIERVKILSEKRTESAKVWKKYAEEEGNQESYALWNQPQITVEQLVFDYGAEEYAFLIPPEVGQLPLSIASNTPIPRAVWSGMLEMILNEKGIEIVPLSPFLKMLRLSNQRLSPLKRILGKPEALMAVPPHERVIFLLETDPAETQRVMNLIEKMRDKEAIHVESFDSVIAISGPQFQIQEILKALHLFIEAVGHKQFTLIPLINIQAEEMARMLAAVFDSDCRIYTSKEEACKDSLKGLKILVLPNMKKALFVVGTQTQVHKAQEIISKIDNQMCSAREKTVFWYTCRNSDPEELAVVVENIYNLMVKACAEGSQEKSNGTNGGECSACPEPLPPQTQNQLYPAGYFQAGDVVVNPAPVEIDPLKSKKNNSTRENFIVDPKTSTIVMVLEKDLVPRIREVLLRLDKPKKMVQIEVLLFEKRTSDKNKFGLNLLRMGSAATQTHVTSLIWNDFLPIGKGLLDFFMSRPKESGIPAFDLSYNFLISQDDIQINASPSILTLNQTPAQIAVVEEMSILTGIYDVETAKGVTLKDSYTRAQYGITLNITPTIHEAAFPGESASVTLDTKVTFDTVDPKLDFAKDRPDVLRRQITNFATIPDGQSVILGGLRRKVSQDSIDKIPFLGEVPLFGKLFCNTTLQDTTTEMFIMITPRIIRDAKEELLEIRREEMCRRPGDIPEYLCRLVAARKCARQRIFEGTLTMILGRRKDRCYSPLWHVDDNK